VRHRQDGSGGDDTARSGMKTVLTFWAVGICVVIVAVLVIAKITPSITP
jgi:hypothetical protein